MAQPAVSPFQTPEPSWPVRPEPELFVASGTGPVAELQQMLAARIADWPAAGDPFVPGPEQRLEAFVSGLSRAAGYVCFGGAVLGIGILAFLA